MTNAIAIWTTNNSGFVAIFFLETSPDLYVVCLQVWTLAGLCELHVRNSCSHCFTKITRNTAVRPSLFHPKPTTGRLQRNPIKLQFGRKLALETPHKLLYMTNNTKIIFRKGTRASCNSGRIAKLRLTHNGVHSVRSSYVWPRAGAEKNLVWNKSWTPMEAAK